jgi:hypothetical protein
MLVLFVIFLILAAVALVGFIRRREAAERLSQRSSPRELPQPLFRPLFQPDAEQLRAIDRSEAENLAEIERLEDLNESSKKLALFWELRQNWELSPTRANTIQLLYEASQAADGKNYVDTCERLVTLWHAGRIAELSAVDLAQLLESHFWLLPHSERTPGVSFRLREEIAGLRRGSEEKT